MSGTAGYSRRMIEIRLSRRVALILALAGACALGCVARPFVVPVATAANVEKWEYFCFMAATEEVMDKADEAGAHGFEMVAATGNHDGRTWCMKPRRR